MLSRFVVCALAGVLLLTSASQALAGCRISNETSYAFTVSSGNTCNQSVGGHTTTSIAAGKILGKSKEGKTIGGFCKDGDELVIKEEKGIPIIMPK